MSRRADPIRIAAARRAATIARLVSDGRSLDAATGIVAHWEADAARSGRVLDRVDWEGFDAWLADGGASGRGVGAVASGLILRPAGPPATTCTPGPVFGARPLSEQGVVDGLLVGGVTVVDLEGPAGDGPRCAAERDATNQRRHPTNNPVLTNILVRDRVAACLT
jgi:hypothetical protein